MDEWKLHQRINGPWVRMVLRAILHFWQRFSCQFQVSHMRAVSQKETALCHDFSVNQEIILKKRIRVCLSSFYTS